MIEIWQADSGGHYNHPDDKPENSRGAFLGYGRLATDDQGRSTFTTIIPGQVPANDGTKQASHINVSVFARGVLARLATRIYFADDPALAKDFVLSLVPAGRRDTLLARHVAQSNEWHFDIRLCGDQETVFFDV
jgi:protocatechuate 3,4-dioxygenase alpha subunit